MQENTQTLENAVQQEAIKDGQPFCVHGRDVAVRPELPRKAFLGPAQGYSDLFRCPAVELPRRFPLSDSLQTPSRFTSFFPLETAAAPTGLFSLQIPFPRAGEGSHFLILIL